MDATSSPQLLLPSEAVWSPGFDAARATDAYLATVPAAARSRSDAYFEGGYWIDLWGVVIALAIAWLWLSNRRSARLRDATERRFRRPNVRVLAFVLAYLAIAGVLLLPWEFYVGYLREQAYGLSNHTAGSFLRDWAVGSLLNIVIGAVAITGLYAIVRRAGRAWAGWATVATGMFMLFVMLVAPVFIAPLFNDYQPLPDGELRDSILALARDNGVPADDVYWFDASRQTTRISAHVSGLLGTTRIALNDNLLEGTTVPEIRAVMAHEMGHYVLHHSLWLPVGFTLLLGCGFWVVDRVFGRLIARRGEGLGIRELADPAGLPLVMAIFTVAFYLLTPFTSSLVRTAEHQADAFGLDAAGEPHGFASVAMRLAQYRKLEPSTLEELVFFDHPSGRTRVERAMQWLEAHPPTGRIATPQAPSR